MKQRIFGFGFVLLALVHVPSFGFSQQKVETQVLPSLLLPATLVPRLSPPTQLPEAIPQQNKVETTPAVPDLVGQTQVPESTQDKKETSRAVQSIREPSDRFRKPEGEPGYPETAFGNGHWHWSGFRYGPRIAPSYEYPGLGGGPKVTYPWGLPGYTGRNDERSLNRVCRLWGPPVPVYTPVPEPSDPKKLIYPGRNISSPGFVYGWVGPFPASPRFRNYAVNTWAQPNVDLSTGRPLGLKDNDLKKPVGNGDSRTPVGDADTKQPVVNTDSRNPVEDAGTRQPVSYMTLLVKVPQAGAELYVDGRKTNQTGTERIFSSPELEPGKEFQYEVTVRWVERGVVYEKKKLIVGSSGEVIPLDFTAPEVVRAGK
jgi:uncharacterized protein (TIGR03000 family)